MVFQRTDTDFRATPTQNLNNNNLTAISDRENIYICRAKYPQISHAGRVRLTTGFPNRAKEGRRGPMGREGWRSSGIRIRCVQTQTRKPSGGDRQPTPTHSALHFNFSSSFTHINIKHHITRAIFLLCDFNVFCNTFKGPLSAESPQQSTLHLWGFIRVVNQ